MLTDFFNLTIPVLEAEMRRVIAEGLNPDSNLLKEIFLYHLGMDVGKEVRGKRVRPLLVFLICHAFQTDWHRALPAASSVEFLHNFSLIHDDIEDRSEERHGRPTVWSKWGAAQAINSGDGMFTLVYQSIQKIKEVTSPEITIEATNLINQTCLKLVEGQILDVSFENQSSVSIEDYYRMIDGKTAALLACCAQLGGLVAGLDSSKMNLLNEFGCQLGRSFQVQDDILGIWGDSRETGKPVANDLTEHKKTLPVLYGLQMSPRFKERWQKKDISMEDITAISTWLMDDGIYAKVESDLSHLNEGTDELITKLNFPSEDGLDMIKELITKLRSRKR